MPAQAQQTPPPAVIRAVPARHPLRWAAAAVIIVPAAMLAHMLATNQNLEWNIVARYLTDPRILTGAAATLELTAAAMAAGIAGGLILALMRLSASPLLPAVSGIYTWFFRGTPVLVQLLFWYNIQALTGGISLGIPFGPAFTTASTNQLITTYVAAVLGLGLNEAAYMSEIIRAGILSVDPGQADAARALGMRHRLVLRRIILPQAMRVIIPPTGNETISMLKATSLVSVIAVTELLKASQDISSVTYQVIPLLIVASIWYLIMTTALSAGQHYIERYYGRGHAGTPRQATLQTLRHRLSGYRAEPKPAAGREGTQP